MFYQRINWNILFSLRANAIQAYPLNIFCDNDKGYPDEYSDALFEGVVGSKKPSINNCGFIYRWQTNVVDTCFY